MKKRSMARTVDRYLNKVEEVTNNNNLTCEFIAGIYTRLSGENRKYDKGLSSSIEMQKAYCFNYSIKENIRVVNVYTDYEYSGTNFERPAYKSMIEDVKNGLINCIIIKDLSRLGREYLEMSMLVEKVFPFLGVRLISIDDNLDTFKDMNVNKIFEINIKNIINDMYAKDISVKVKSSIEIKAKNGYFIGSHAPYGYKILKTQNGQKLVIDDNVKHIVENIFSSYLNGTSSLVIVRNLNENRISTPIYYSRTKNVCRNDDETQWTRSSLFKILKNRTYVGDLVQCRNSGNNKRIVFENSHEAIVSREDFEKVQHELKFRKKESGFCSNKYSCTEITSNKYRGLLFDENNKPLLMKRVYSNFDKKIKRNIFTNKIYDGRLFISYVTISEKELDCIIKDVIEKMLASLSLNKINFISRVKEIFSKEKQMLEIELCNLNEELKKANITINENYENYKLGIISKDYYQNCRRETEIKIEILHERILNTKRNKKIMVINKRYALRFVERVLSVKNEFEIDVDILNLLVDKIIIKKNNCIKILVKFDINKLNGGYFSGS